MLWRNVYARNVSLVKVEIGSCQCFKLRNVNMEIPWENFGLYLENASYKLNSSIL